MLTAQRARTAHRTDAGIGMVEVLVTVVITSIIGTMVTLFFVATVDGTRAADGRNAQAAAARATLESWSLLIRLAVSPASSLPPYSTAPGADRFYSVDPTSIRFCAALGTKGDSVAVKPAAIGVRLALESGNLMEYRWLAQKADGTPQDGCAVLRAGSLTTYQQKRTLVPRASLLPGTWLFTPFDQADMPTGDVVSAELVPSDLIIGTAAMTPENRLRIAGVQLAFQTASDPSHPAVASTFTTVTALTTGS